MNKAQEIATSIKFSAAAIGAMAANLLGGWDMMLQVLVAMSIIDFITGVMAGAYTKKLSSNVSYKGLIKKIGIYVMVAMACFLDKMMNTNMMLRTAMIGFYIATEGISILENMGRMDMPLPKFIKDMLIQLKEKTDQGGTHE
jgi:toxin secretion/phage lysis holin